MTRPTLKAKARENSGSGASRQYRNQKLVPAVLYGKSIDSRLLTVSDSDMVALFNSGRANSLLEMTVGRKKYSVVIKDIQRDHIKGHLTHIDFHSVDLDQPVNATVAIHLNGEPEGVKAGGILQQQLREVDIRCLPTVLPGRLELNIDDVGLGGTKTAADLVLPEGVELITDQSEVVVSVQAPRAEVVETEDDSDVAEAEAPVAEPASEEE